MSYKKLIPVSKFLNNLEKYIKKALSKKIGSIGKELHTEFKDRTFDGYGVQKGKLKKLKKLKKSTIKNREYLQRAGKLHPSASPSVSQQIATGDMVYKSKLKVNKKDLEIELSPPQNREDVAQYQEETGRVIFEATKDQLDHIEKVVDEVSDQVIKDLLKGIK